MIGVSKLQARQKVRYRYRRTKEEARPAIGPATVRPRSGIPCEDAHRLGISWGQEVYSVRFARFNGTRRHHVLAAGGSDAVINCRNK